VELEGVKKGLGGGVLELASVRKANFGGWVVPGEKR